MGRVSSKLSAEDLTEFHLKTHCNPAIESKEIQGCHVAFLRECPSGYLSKEQFLKIYAEYFPFGDSSVFATLLFRLYDSDASGAIGFSDYLAVLSVTARGHLEEKIRWAFKFYDQDGDGVISRADLSTVLDAIYRMLGHKGSGCAVVDEVERVFNTMCKETQMFLTLDEFRAGAHDNPAILKAILVYDAVC